MSIIKAGAGEALIKFNEVLFPTPGEKYTGIHDDPSVHALCFAYEEHGTIQQYVFLGLNLVSYPEINELQELAEKITGAPKTHVLVHCNHNLTTPHGGMHMDTEEEIAFTKKYCEIISNATKTALQQAAERMNPAELFFHTAVSNVNVSRILNLKDGMWQGTNDAGVSDHTIPVIEIKNQENGACIAIFYAVNMAPGVMEGSLLEDGGRLISGDVAASSEYYLKKMYPGAVCCYCLGASGDQWQQLRAVTDMLNPQGELIRKDLHETGFIYVDALGRKLSSSIVASLRESVPAELGTCLMETREFTYPGQKELGRNFNSMHPGKVHFEPAEDICSDTTVLKLGDIAIVAAHAEINCASLDRIRKSTKCSKIFFIAFTNGTAGYMTEKEVYDAGGYQCRKSQFARGSAEIFEKNIAAFLDEVM